MNKTPPPPPPAAIEVSALRPYDILCGRSKNCFNNIGNRRFRVTMGMNVKRYDSIATRSERGKFIISLAHTLKDDVGFRFFRILKNGEKVELTEEEARAKIGHALRDLSASLREGTSKPPNKPKIARKKKKVIKARTMKSTQLEDRSMKLNIVTPTLKKDTLCLDACASQRPSLVAGSMVPSFGENNDSNNSSNNNLQEKDWDLPVAISSAALLPWREQVLGEFGFSPLDVYGCDAATATAHDDDFPLLHPLQHEVEESPILSDLLPSPFGECSHPRVVSMPLNLSSNTEENSHADSSLFFYSCDTKTSLNSFFSSTDQLEDKVATCSMSTDDHDEADKDLSVSVAHPPHSLGRVVVQ
eukprot:scaffold417_cov97-Cylindrotheca_fusiformis.AAC.6